MARLPMRGGTFAVAAAVAMLCSSCGSCGATVGRGHPPTVMVSVHPSTAGVLPGGAQGFAAYVTGTEDTRVTSVPAESRRV